MSNDWDIDVVLKPRNQGKKYNKCQYVHMALQNNVIRLFIYHK